MGIEEKGEMEEKRGNKNKVSSTDILTSFCLGS